MVKRGANLYDIRGNQKTLLPSNHGPEGRKENAVNAIFDISAMRMDGNMESAQFTRRSKSFLIPKRKKIDALIASCAPKGATLLHNSKGETAARVGEALH